MAEGPTTRVVLHPRHVPGIAAALRAIDGLDLALPDDEGGVAAELAAGAPVLVTFQWADEFLQPGLRWLQSISAGVEQFPTDRLATAGVVLTSARGVHGPQVAEHAFALLLALTRRVGEAMRSTANRTWRPGIGEELGGKTLGVLGLGVIGEEVARRGAAFGMRVVGTKRDPSSYRGVATTVLPGEETLEVCAMSDALVVTLPGGIDTHHLVGRKEIAALGPGWVVNVGRGSVIDTEALIEALAEGRLLGAGLDVFEDEPLAPDSPLWDMPRVVITPHIAGLSPRYGPRLAEIVRVNLEALAGRGPWMNRVDGGAQGA